MSEDFGLKLNGAVRFSRKSIEKMVHLSRWTSFLDWTGPIEMGRSNWTFRPILNPSTALFAIFHIQHWGKHLSLQLLWIVNNESISVTHTSMCSYNRSLAASQAKCMFWLFYGVSKISFANKIALHILKRPWAFCVDMWLFSSVL